MITQTPTDSEKKKISFATIATLNKMSDNAITGLEMAREIDNKTFEFLLDTFILTLFRRLFGNTMFIELGKCLERINKRAEIVSENKDK